MTPPRRTSKLGHKTSRILRPTLPPKTKAKLDKLSTPLDRKQQALREKEEQLREATEQLKKLIEEAPRRKEEQARRRREQIASDTRLPTRPAILDKRFDVSVTMDSTLGSRPLRSEKRDGKLYFIFLCVVFIGLLIWLTQTLWDYTTHF